MFASWMIEPVLVPIVWFVKDMKSNLGAAGIRTHDLRIRGPDTLPLDQLSSTIELKPLPPWSGE